MSELLTPEDTGSPQLPGRAGALSLDAFLQRRAADRRLARLTHDIVLPAARGLEFAAAPALPLPEGFRIETVDFTRAEAGPDHVWTGVGTLAERGAYNFAIADGVAHRAPNLLGWFRGVFEALAVGGVLNLSLPDRRFTQDCARRTSTIAEAVEADARGDDRPSPRQWFDHAYNARATDPARRWAEESAAEALPRRHGDDALAEALRLSREASSAPPGACSCWVFTPLSFLDLIEEAGRLRLFPFVVSQFAATEPGESEFFVCLRRDAEAEAEPGRLRDMQIGAIGYVRALARRSALAARRLAED